MREVVVLKPYGEPFIHTQKLLDGVQAAGRALEQLRALVADPTLAPEERAQAQQLLEEYSQKLDQAKDQYSRALEALRTSPDDVLPTEVPSGAVKDLERLERKVTLGLATSEEKVSFAALTGQLGSVVHVPLLWKLLDDEDSEVRHYSLQSLVLDLLQKDPAMLDRCWQILESDEDEDVRRMAAVGIGTILYGSNDLTAVDRLKKIMQAAESKWLQEALYRTMLKLAGASPREWANLEGDWSAPPTVDWADVARVEDRIRAAQPR